VNRFGARLITPAVAVSLALASCQPQGAAPPAAPPPASTPPAIAPSSDATIAPPPAGVVPDAPFPTIQKRELDNGLGLYVVERRVHPLIELRLIVRSGSATNDDKPGLAVVAGELLKAGGAGGMSPLQLIEKAESLGTNLDVVTDRDSTRIGLNVTAGHLDAALEILSAVATRPAFLPVEFKKLRDREIERVKSSARGSAAWAASMVLYRELYELPTSVHPYSRYDAMPGELEKLTLADCRAWHAAHFVPSNATLVVVGDVSVDDVLAASHKVFSTWKGTPAPKPSVSNPFPPKERAVYLVDRPGSGQSQIYVGMIGPERKSADWPGLAVANQVLGGGVSGRLFQDVREKRSLAYNTGSSLVEVATGPVALVLSAGTQTAKAQDAVRALLENLELIADRSPTDAEVERARTFLSDSFLFRLETVGSVAELTSNLIVLGLPDDYYDEYRKAVRGIGVQNVAVIAGKNYDRTPIIVVAGDAAVLGPQLAAFGPVAVLNPETGFTLKRSFPKKP
jgi:zinc protease